MVQMFFSQLIISVAAAGPVLSFSKDIKNAAPSLMENAVDEVEDCGSPRKDLYHQILDFDLLSNGKTHKSCQEFKKELERTNPVAAEAILGFCNSVGTLDCDGTYSGHAFLGKVPGGERPVLVMTGHGIVNRKTHQYKQICHFWIGGNKYKVGPRVAGSLNVWKDEGLNDWAVGLLEDPAAYKNIPAVPLILSSIQGKDSVIERVDEDKSNVILITRDIRVNKARIADNCTSFFPGRRVDDGLGFIDLNYRCNAGENDSGGLVLAYGDPFSMQTSGAVCIHSSEYNVDYRDYAEYVSDEIVEFHPKKRFNSCVPFAGEFRQAIENVAKVRQTQLSKLPE